MNSILALLLMIPNFSYAMGLEEFRSAMDKHMKSLSKKAEASVHLEVMGKGTPLFSYDSDKLLLPASNAKLVTAITALEQLGPGFSYETNVYEKNGALVVEGSGDPYLVSERLWLLVRDIARKGIKKVSSITINNYKFGPNYAGLMDWSESGEPYTAMVSGTSLNFNSMEIRVTPEGKKAHLEVAPYPHNYAKIRNEVSVVGGNKKSLVARLTQKEPPAFVVSGSIGRELPSASAYSSVPSPEKYFAYSLAAALRAEGITVEKEFAGVQTSPLSEGYHLVASIKSLPLLDLVRLFNTYSNNFMAEQVFQSLARAGLDPAKPVSAKDRVMDFLKRIDTCKKADLENGSGLSWESRVSAHCFVDLLQSTYRNFRVFADLLGSLPVGGETGSLKNRFKHTGDKFDPLKVRAKTGTLWSKKAVTSLVGFTQTSSGETVAFAIIVNDQRNDPGLLSVQREWEDRSVELIQQLAL